MYCIYYNLVGNMAISQTNLAIKQLNGLLFTKQELVIEPVNIICIKKNIKQRVHDLCYFVLNR